MTVHLDTSALVAAFAGNRPELGRLTALLVGGHRLAASSIVLYEWRRGPRTGAELEVQGAVIPDEAVCPFGVEEALSAAQLYRLLPRPHGRDLDLAIAACALVDAATLWTMNRRDFDDLPGLKLL